MTLVVGTAARMMAGAAEEQGAAGQTVELDVA